ncbi:peptidase inhibitor family I36 protein [Streptomyces sp. M92]|uniref:peptidase inhibitor family I36 protein n=1 Tax=Streptomyces sp. M92 TaxID=2944250 RepID=UPI002349D716|nr:peptidase inhibitor family I36 protein [Streptomyces sp. M92]WCN05071.1 peptidase inhibitor family I36 protein [Streptomyces sp. M92]
MAVAAAAATLIMPATTAATASETRVVGAQGVYYYTGSDVRARAWGDCRDGWTCFFTEYDGGGAMWRVPSCGRHVVPAAFNDQLTSGWNRTPTTIDLYLNSNFTGFMGGVPGHWQGQLAPSDNDRTSSVDARC